MLKQKRPEPGQPILIEIGDRLLELKFPLRILKELDAKHGVSVLGGVGMADAFTNPAKLALLMMYGLRTKQPEIDEAWVDDNIDASMLLGLAPVLTYATTGRYPKLNLGDEEETQAANPPAATPTTGSPSGPSGVTTSPSVSMISGNSR